MEKAKRFFSNASTTAATALVSCSVVKSDNNAMMVLATAPAKHLHGSSGNQPPHGICQAANASSKNISIPPTITGFRPTRSE
ncbi:MAG: hypothetical protein R3E57_02565 [Porticoccaceae bacterium]